MLSKALFVVVTTITVVNGLSINENCDPGVSGSCQKGDLIAKTVADCCYTGGKLSTCKATDNVWNHRTISPAKGDKCQPCSGNHKFTCGQAGTDTRCVCDDKSALDILDPNRCRCRYWPAAAPSNTTTPATPTTPSKSTTGSPSDTKRIITIAVPTAVGGVILISVVVLFAVCGCYVRYSKRGGYTSINNSD